MRKNYQKMKPYIKYFLVFFFFLFWNLIVSPVSLDEIWNYGFAHNIYRGVVPYKDFNMVLTPLFPMLMSLPFHLFGSSMLVFHIEWAIILTILFYILNGYFKEKSYLFLVFMIFPLSVTFPSYNMFLFFLFLVLMKAEDESFNDYFIGFILALFVLTKQTVGFMMLLPTLYYLKQPKKIGRRFIGFIIPIFIFIFYLVATNSWLEFLDLCFFGLFDFASSNHKGFNIFFILSLIMFVINFYFMKKNRNRLKNYYFMAFFSLLIPLFDMYHFEIVFLAFLFILLEQKNFKCYLNLKLFSIGVVLGLTIVTLGYRKDSQITYPNDIKYFNYRYLTSSYIHFSNQINNLIEKYKDREIIFLSADGYYFRIINDMDIGYFDLINTGNWGYHGSFKLLEEIKNKKNCVFFVDKNELGSNKQTDQESLRYVISHGKILEIEGSYYIYEME